MNLLTCSEPDRFLYHDLLRVYAVELVNEVEGDDERRQAQKRLFSHYLYSAYVARCMLSNNWVFLREPILDGVVVPGVGSRSEAIAWYEAEHHNLAALQHLAVSGRFSEYVGIVQMSTWYFLDITSRWEQAAALSELALGYLETVADPFDYACTLRIDLAASHGRRGRFEESIRYSRAVLAGARERGDLTLERKALNNLGMAYSELGRNHEALEFVEAALEICSRDTARSGKRIVLDTRAAIHRKLGRPDQAEACLREALELNREADDAYSTGLNLAQLGAVYTELRKWDRASEVLLEALELSRANGDRYNQATTLSRLGDVLEGSGDHGGADASRRQALDIFDELDAPEARALRDGLVATSGGA